MSALIIRMPEEKRERLKTLAKSRNISVNKLIEEMATVMLAEFDAETRFRLRAARGRDKQERGLELLRKAAKPRSLRSRGSAKAP
jgi:predicted DNA-binding protein